MQQRVKANKHFLTDSGSHSIDIAPFLYVCTSVIFLVEDIVGRPWLNDERSIFGDALSTLKAERLFHCPS